ncbi:hypothetical protein [Sphaerotilus sp.]|uniref:hypothetical protein n=1 Tax=Sphaerotilus sp. TaxID=2093942 RepID=UPI00286E34FE|nr:hypothetical protein [Sphaerotilus sp.]
MLHTIFSLMRCTLRQSGLISLLGLFWMLGACSPTLNWRDVEIDPQTRAQFPCRPEHAERPLVLAGVPVRAEMRACEAGGLSWSATVLDVGDPTRLTAVLRESRLSLATRLQGREESVLPAQINGMTPNEEARRVVIVGKTGEGRPARAEAVFVVRGLQVFQFVVMAQRGAPVQWAESADEFLRSVRWPG